MAQNGFLKNTEFGDSMKRLLKDFIACSIIALFLWALLIFGINREMERIEENKFNTERLSETYEAERIVR
jgi:hypothetical protein